MENRAEGMQGMDMRALKHDLRAPIANVIALAQLSMSELTDGAAQEKIMPYLSRILAAAQELQLMTGDAAQGEGKAARFTALHIAQTLGATLGAQAAQKNQLLRIDVSALGGGTLRGERTALMRILTNLLGNAVKYTPAGGRVSLTARRIDAAQAEFTVEDDGMGMKPEFMARMFEPFERAPEVMGGEIAGCGLGLSIVRRLTAQLGGHIEAKSEWGKGTAFTLRVPLKAEDGEQKALEGMRFLLAEDNDLSAEIAQVILEEKGASVCRAADGTQAVKRFASLPEGTFDAILLDMRMPELGGCGAAEAIRKMARADAGRIPILALTAGGDTQDEREALAAGMNGCLKKPLDVQALQLAIK